MASHVILTFFNAALTCILTSLFAYIILKKEYAPYLEEEANKEKGKK